MSEVRPFDGEAGQPLVDTGERGPIVVVTAMELSRAAREALAERMGPGHVVRDIRRAGNTADIVLVPSSSPQLIGALRGMFPGARILVTELQDDEFGADFTGPVSTLAAQGVDGYFVASSLDHLAAITYETGQGRRPIGALGDAGASAMLPALESLPAQHASLSISHDSTDAPAPHMCDAVIINLADALSDLPPDIPSGIARTIVWSLAQQLISQGVNVHVIADDHGWWRDRAREAGLNLI